MKKRRNHWAAEAERMTKRRDHYALLASTAETATQTPSQPSPESKTYAEVATQTDEDAIPG